MTRPEITDIVIKAQQGDKSALEEIYLFTRSYVSNKIHASISNPVPSQIVRTVQKTA